MRIAFFAVLLLSALSGCSIRRQPTALPPRPLIPPPPVERPLKIAILEDAPELTLPVPELPAYEPEIPSARPPRVRPVKPPVVRSKKESTDPAKTVVAPSKPASPGFRLGDVLTPAQRTDLGSQIDSFLGAAEQARKTATSQTLNADQKVLADQVHALVLQSRLARNVDLVESRKLAERANTLADALLRSLGN